MAFLHDVGTAFKALWIIVKNSFKEKKVENGKTKKTDRSTSAFLIVLVGVGLVYGGFWSYRWYGARREAQAQKTFADVLQLVEQAKQNPQQWADVAAACTAGYDLNSSSKLAPFFLLYRADALVAQGDVAQAMTVMQDGISKMSSSNPVRSLYAVKLGLMKIDSADQTVKAAGLQELEKLAQQDTAGADMAAYYLGLHFWQAGDVQKAKDAWKRLIGTSSQENASPYAGMVDEKIKQIE
jgi:hypothetical protein